MDSFRDALANLLKWTQADDPESWCLDVVQGDAQLLLAHLDSLDASLEHWKSKADSFARQLQEARCDGMRYQRSVMRSSEKPGKRGERVTTYIKPPHLSPKADAFLRWVTNNEEGNGGPVWMSAEQDPAPALECRRAGLVKIDVFAVTLTPAGRAHLESEWDDE